MKQIAFIFCLISTIISGFALIPLIWCIPMTIRVYKAYKGEDYLTVGFKVCVLLFVSLVSGILLLCDQD